MAHIGTAVFTDFNGYLNWYNTLSPEDAESFCAQIQEVQPDCLRRNSPLRSQMYDMFINGRWNGFGCEVKQTYWERQQKKGADKLQDFYRFSTTYNIPIRVSEWHEGVFAYLYLGNPDEGIIVPTPEKYLEYTKERDFSDMTPAQVRNEYSLSPSSVVNSLIPQEAESTLSPKNVAQEKEQQEAAIQLLKEKIDDVKNARSGELAKMQAEIEKLQAKMVAKKQALMEELNARMAEMQEQKENLENQIYLLDSQIYAIRCFAGEVVKFTQLRKGQNAPITEPVVIYQKLHFLDEDLGRLTSLYEVEWGNIKYFEDFLTHSPAALETFTPNERCVSLVRLSKDNKRIGTDNERPWACLLDKYEYYHGRTVGIIIRNGENLYLGWTDEDRVHIKDDLIITTTVTATEPVEFTGSYEWEEQKRNRKIIVDGIISRSFIYNILQGVVENTPILPLPAGVTLGKQSEYVVYAVADRWISDTRFGSFTEIIERCNSKLTEGDQILTMQHLHPSYDRYSPHNDRGRGYANRTHDVSAVDCTIYPINLIEFDPPVEMLRYRYPCVHFPGEPPYQECTIKKRGADLSEECQIIEEFTVQDRHAFISLEKEYSDCGARSNFEIYSGEYINLTYMNSVWLKWVITNKTLGDWRIGGVAVNYAYAIRYLNKAMEFIREREKREKLLLDAVNPEICKDPDWPLRLSEWKLEKGIRTITAYQAKRFAKFIGSKKE